MAETAEAHYLDQMRIASERLTGVAVSLVNYVDELPFFCEEVLPRLQRAGLREKL